MQMTGNELIKWIEERGLGNSHVYNVNEKSEVKSVSVKQLIVDECGDILICNRED